MSPSVMALPLRCAASLELKLKRHFGMNESRKLWLCHSDARLVSDLKIEKSLQSMRLLQLWLGHSDARQVSDLPSAFLTSSVGLRPSFAVTDRRILGALYGKPELAKPR